MKFKQVQREYPYFGKLPDSDIVVLFVGKLAGIKVSGSSPSHTEIGEFVDDWSERFFERIAGTLELD